MDDDGSKSLSFEEFSKGIKDVGVSLSKEQEYELFRLFDKDGQGTINFDEFLRTVQVGAAAELVRLGGVGGGVKRRESGERGIGYF